MDDLNVHVLLFYLFGTFLSELAINCELLYILFFNSVVIEREVLFYGFNFDEDGVLRNLLSGLFDLVNDLSTLFEEVGVFCLSRMYCILFSLKQTIESQLD